MDFLHAIVLAVVEGVTEFLPVSSTGHMMMAANLLDVPNTDFLKTFEIAIQLGAIMAVVVLYWRVFLLDWEKMAKVATAFVPTAVIGFVLYKVIKKFLLGNIWVFIWALFLGGVALLVFESFYQEKKGSGASIEQISWTQALWIGVCQALAVIPGVSRSGATIVGGMLLGIKRSTIVEFSFLLAVPTVLAATVWDLLKTEAVIGVDQWLLLAMGFGVAFLVALVVVKSFLAFIRRFNFSIFGIYRVVAALLCAGILWGRT